MATFRKNIKPILDVRGDRTMIVMNSYRFGGDVDSFIFTINTNLGTGASFTLPLRSGFNYNFNVDWGDNSSSEITAYNDPDITHTYASHGIYTITISGTCESWYFNNGGDKLKMTGITSFGNVGFTSLMNSFYGCANITGNLPDISNIISIDNNNMFFDCTGLRGSIVFPDGTLLIDNGMFRNTRFDGTLTIPSGVTTIGPYAFGYSIGSFTGDLIIPETVTSIGLIAFFQCSGFNGTLRIPSGISTINQYTFQSCSGFTNVECYPAVAPTVVSPGMSLGGTPRPLHVPVGASGYNITPWTDTSIFSTIIFDL